MASDYVLPIFVVIGLFQPFVQGRGTFMLYRPIDITNDCLHSQKLRYDLSFGMGMSDTITLVFRTIPDVDYECEVDVNSDATEFMYAVLRYPNAIGYNCEMNFRAFHVMQRDQCHPVCEMLDDTNVFSRYWMIIKKGRFRFQYRSNSSVDTDMDAYVYEVTVTTARKRAKNQKCFKTNETECCDLRNDDYYCMTSGILCDGIKNCGVEDWYDERKSECDIPIQQLGYPPILAVVTLIMCVILAALHILQRCFPQTTSFFIFNTNGDNKLYINPVFKAPTKENYQAIEKYHKRKSIIPIDWSSSSGSESEETNIKIYDLAADEPWQEMKTKSTQRGASTVSQMTKMLNHRLLSVVGLSYHDKLNYDNYNDPDSN